MVSVMSRAQLDPKREIMFIFIIYMQFCPDPGYLNTNYSLGFQNF